MNNAYTRIMGVIQDAGRDDAVGAGPVRMRLGRVTSRLPLRLSVAGIDIPAAAVRRSAGETGLCPGDRVLLLTEDDQSFYLLCKVVSA